MSLASSPARHVIAVGAGKGGVGKSTVAVGLAMALAEDATTGLLDLDLYGPNIPAMLGIEHTSWTHVWTLARARTASERPRFQPAEVRGLHVVSAGFILGEDQPMGLDPASAGLFVRQLITDVAWPAGMAYLVVDLPPGTSAVQHVLVRQLRVSGAIVVVTPQTIAHLDARKAVRMFRTLRIPVIGGVENMAGVRCAHCGEVSELFPATTSPRSIWAMNVDRLVSLPFDPRIARDDLDGALHPQFQALAQAVQLRLQG